MLKRHINNPYKLNWKLYCLICVGSVAAMIAAVIHNTITGSTVSDIIKNLALGVVSKYPSTRYPVVASEVIS